VAAYATLAELSKFGRAGKALDGLDTSTRTEQLEAASRVADGYLRGRVTLPLKGPFGKDLVQAVCKIAAFELLGNLGLNPEVEQDLSKARSESIAWLRDIASGTATPEWLDSSVDGAVGYDDDYVVVPGLDDDGNATVTAPTPRGL
jgi:phage gp36-like protein